ncbi:DUF4040 domain-containing protein [Natronosporangium hydrolyticum]|uniref:DUF4040 domain-containing protein n=1 Tax=Natronosporangium hydrolyticum TaxID=2811111 RepID=A0A895Y5V6_9ACTN|nr:hydrogen gas-evolving membrane-bound hydrogenase subunit E [Natronosporangium hydrolyticum]QSB13107.1 DUF4040 domain-containing protein [Natronosporangium hydrolyticum]
MILFIVLAGMMGLALLVAPISRRFGRDTGYFLAAAFLLLGALLTPSILEALGGGYVEESLPWIPALGVQATLRLDGLASLFTLLIILVGALILAYCPRYLHGDHHARTYILLTLFAASMLGLVLSADLVLLFVFWELTTISSFFLIGGTGPKSAKPAMRALIITAAGGLALLVAVIMIWAETGTTYLPAVLDNPEWLLESPYGWSVGALVILAAFTKSAQLPFQSWLPGAMVAITPVSAYLHAATMVKAGIYLLMRFSPVYGDQAAWQATLVSVGLITAIVGAALALRQHDLKALLAYSTVSQLGLLVAVTGIGTSIGFAAAVLHTVAHALFKATLFMLVGIIDREAGSRDVRELGGLRRVMPVTAALTGIAGLSMAGVPPMIGFVSKETIFEALSEAHFAPWAGPVAAGLGVTASVLTFAYGVRIFHGAFAGPTTQRNLYEPSWQFLLPAAVPAVAGVVLGPGVGLLNPLTQSAVANMDPGAVAPVLEFWHGFSIELWLSAITIALGMVLFFAREPVDRFLNRIKTPPEGELFDYGYNATLKFGWWVGAPNRSNSPAAFLIWPMVVVLVLGAGALFAYGSWPTDPPGTTTPYDWPLIALLAVASAALVAMRNTLAAIALLGVIGFLVSIWFMLAGAPDVALTLLLVEVLTAVVAVLVLRTLPPKFRRVPKLRQLPAAVVAIATGVLAMAATLAFTGHRDRSELGDYFLSNAEEQTGGRNVVNTILVDYRALDTLGEATVLGVAALGAIYLLGRFRVTRPASDPNAAPAPQLSSPILFQVTNWVLAPGLLLLSAYLFLRGHYEPGGGFIAALVAGIAIAFGYLAQGITGGTVPVLRALKPEPLIALGLGLSVLVGGAAAIGGEPFLTPLHLEFGDFKLTSSLLFDVGIYLFVLGMVVAAIDRLGGARREPPPEPADAAAPTPDPAGTPRPGGDA